MKYIIQTNLRINSRKETTVGLHKVNLKDENASRKSKDIRPEFASNWRLHRGRTYQAQGYVSSRLASNLLTGTVSHTLRNGELTQSCMLQCASSVQAFPNESLQSSCRTAANSPVAQVCFGSWQGHPSACLAAVNCATGPHPATSNSSAPQTGSTRIKFGANQLSLDPRHILLECSRIFQITEGCILNPLLLRQFSSCQSCPAYKKQCL